jgi:hypothetical protein
MWHKPHPSNPSPAQSIPLAASPTRWPLFDDAILVGRTGLARSARLGSTVDLNAAIVFAATAAANISGRCDAETESYNCTSASKSATAPITLDSALSSPAVVLSAAIAAWRGVQLLPNATAQAPSSGFSLTLAGVSWVALRGAVVASPRRRLSQESGSVAEGARPFTNATTAWLGGAPCTIAAVSSDGLWALLQTPSPEALCGSNTTPCGYAPLSLSNPGPVLVNSGSEEGSALQLPAYNVTVACPTLVNPNPLS